MTQPNESSIGHSSGWSVTDPTSGSLRWNWHAWSSSKSETGSAGSESAAEALARAGEARLVRNEAGRI